MKRFNANSRVPIRAKWAFCCLFMLTAAITNQAGAEDALPTDTLFAQWERASDSELDALRGGFVMPNGVNIDLSIEKVVLINGALIATQNFQLPENMVLVQNGIRNNYAAPEGQGSTLGSVIQNTLDNQTIQTMNTINVQLSNFKNLDAYYNGIGVQDFIQPQ